ncbi:MAG TPA: DUF4350 domain-containing protein, partial [Polyangiaceae bacterium]|nr:DUF4350 domain-containing protein [Polyangiaceae bacterium]
GLQAGYRTEPLDRLDDSVGVLVVLPGAGPEDNNWKPLFDWVKKGGRLVLAGELPPVQDLELALVEEEDAKSTALIPAGLYYYRFDRLTGQLPPGFAFRIPAGEHDVEPVLTRDEANGPHYAVHQLRDQGEVVVFADERLFTNIALTVDHNAELVLELLRDAEKIEIVDPWTQAGAETPLESVHKAGLTALIVQLLLLLLLYVLWRGIIFGTPRDPEQRTRRSFAEHVRAVGMQYARAQAGGHALGAYAAWVLERLRERLPRGRQLSLDALAAEVAARSGRDPGEVSRLLHEAQAASDATAPGSYRPESLKHYAPQQGGAEQRIQVVNELTALLASLR